MIEAKSTAKTQAAFETMTRHLLTQNEVSKIGHICAYRAEGGLKCAVGCLIPDEVYTQAMEGKRIVSLMNEHELVRDALTGIDYRVLEECQEVHDCLPVPRWRDGLLTVAALYGLAWPEGL